MKKTILYICILLTMLLTLSACATAVAGSAEPAASSGSASAASEVLPSTAEELGRDASTTLIMTLEGMEEKVPATLYVGQTGGGYSLYIPSEGWTNTQDGCWSPDVNTDVSLEIRFDGGTSAEQASAELTRSGSGYELYGFAEQEQGVYRGRDKERSMTVQVRLAETSDGTYEIWQIYPDEAAEGFGARLGFLADTFQVNP